MYILVNMRGLVMQLFTKIQILLTVLWWWLLVIVTFPIVVHLILPLSIPLLLWLVILLVDRVSWMPPVYPMSPIPVLTIVLVAVIITFVRGWGVIAWGRGLGRIGGCCRGTATDIFSLTCRK